ncbi:hypothetical protein [Streptococcus constellatus]|uniref:hypothetical protein n=1 Tax=Streptococcus constellatus TaxID=76860 RepID=UPI002104DDB0|nr:hypothetical protein [Streptococcus constellatus]UTX65161.1 hypothetical protein DEH83_07865 [Streptococcus constellatus]
MVEYEENKLIVNGEIIRCFMFGIRSLIEQGDEIIVLLEIPFNNNTEKNNILKVDFRGNIVWTIDNSGYSNNIYPFEQMILKDGWLYATDFYARRSRIDIKTGEIVEVLVSK